jgi:hypothetical protein
MALPTPKRLVAAVRVGCLVLILFIRRLETLESILELIKDCILVFTVLIICKFWELFNGNGVELSVIILISNLINESKKN